jgi:hypothetical protein
VNSGALAPATGTANAAPATGATNTASATGAANTAPATGAANTAPGTGNQVTLEQLFPPEYTLLDLGRLLSTEKEGFSKKVAETYNVFRNTTILTIILGFLTTVLVSLSSTEFGRGNSIVARIVSILAIVFPALGTATAAMIAFYAPQAEWNQASRSFASITQLYKQIQLQVVSKQKCVVKDGVFDQSEGDQFADALEAWRKNYENIVSLAYSLARDTNTSGTQSPGTGPRS